MYVYQYIRMLAVNRRGHGNFDFSSNMMQLHADL